MQTRNPFEVKKKFNRPNRIIIQNSANANCSLRIIKPKIAGNYLIGVNKCKRVYVFKVNHQVQLNCWNNQKSNTTKQLFLQKKNNQFGAVCRYSNSILLQFNVNRWVLLLNWWHKPPPKSNAEKQIAIFRNLDNQATVLSKKDTC